jgi:ribosomal protein L37E
MEDDFDFNEDDMYDSCPNCGRDYDEIDYDYQMCSRCGYDTETRLSNA